jgi:tetratricopeptide (TPR) repeat protein
MDMSKSIIPALVAVITLAAGTLQSRPAVAEDTAPAPDITMSLRKSFIAAQDALQAKHYQDVIAKVQEILASSNRKPDDTYYAYYLLFQANRALGNEDEERKALEGVVNAGFLSADQQALYLKPLMLMAFQSKNYDAAVDYGTRLTQSNHGDPEVFSTIGQSYYLKSDFMNAARFYNSLIGEQIKRGQTPREHDLRMLASSYHKLGDNPAETDTIEKLVVYYPKTEYWEPLMYAVRNIPTLQPRQKLQVCRLMWATRTMKVAADYNRCYEAAIVAGLPAEAQQFLDAGLKANVYTDDMEKAGALRRSTSAGNTAASDKAGLPKLEADGKAAATGELDVSVGMTYYSYGEFAKAVEALQRGLGKGALKGDTQVEASITLGLAQLQAGDKAGALQTLKSVKTDDKDWQRIARLWTLYAS